MTLIALAYVSIANKEMTDEDLKALLETARTFNRHHHITGLLLYRDGLFVQAIEGDSEVVDPLFAKICQDRRHRNVLLVYRNEIQTRSFQDWSMGFNKITDGEAAKIHGLNAFMENKHDMNFFTTSTPSPALNLLHAFKEQGLYF